MHAPASILSYEEGLVGQNRCELMTITFSLLSSKNVVVVVVFFNMCNKSEHSANKFRYPDVLENAELLQSPAHSESTMKEFATFSEADIKQTVGPLALSPEGGADNANVRRWTFTRTTCFCYYCRFLM